MSNVGYPDVRAAVAKSLNERFETSFDEKNIIMSVGAAGGLNVILKTLINPNDEVIVISPFFVEYGNYVSNYDGKLVIVPACRFNFEPDPETLRVAITHKTKAVILNSPNNPTGVIYTEETIEQIAEVLTEKSKEYGTSIYIISDEPYRELAYDDVKVPFITKYYKNTIICYSWSKSLSLPGQRIGYIVLPGELDDYELIFDAAGIATRILGYVNAPSLIQKVVAKCLNEQTDIKAYDANRKLLYNGLKDLGFESVYPQGAFYLWVKTPGTDRDFVEAAKKLNILIVPGSAFTCPGYARIAYCVSHETIKRSLPAFKKLAEEFGLKNEVKS
jgi:aspartate aminotransferase